MPKSTLSNPRGVRGAASLCAVAALAYLFVQDLLTIFVSALMGMRVQGASLSDPVGFSVAAQGLLGIVVAAGSIVLPLWWLLRATRLQTQDLRLADLGGSALEIIRTYNSQSAETDGPFGAKWATEYGQHLRLFNDGSVGYRRADGSEIIFYIQPDGTFTSNSTEYESLAYDDARTEYRIALTDGTVYAFASGGLLSRIEEDGGQHVTQIVRDEDGLITKIIAPSQEELLVEMDENGHIVKLTTPGGAELTYQYKGRNLVSFTDANGETTKYQYDSQGRMTAWQAPGAKPVR